MGDSELLMSPTKDETAIQCFAGSACSEKLALSAMKLLQNLFKSLTIHEVSESPLQVDSKVQTQKRVVSKSRRTNKSRKKHNANGRVQSGSASTPLKLRLPEATTAKPTFTHMAIRKLVDLGYVRHVVSQNVDGLHVRSGLPREKLSELHGNLFLEQCVACDTIVMRDFDVAETTGRSQHLTGRICPQCRLHRPGACFLAEQNLSTAVERQQTRGAKSKRKLSPHRLMLVRKNAATQLYRLSKSTSGTSMPSHSVPPGYVHSERVPLLRDVIVHFYERQPVPGLEHIYRVSEAIEAVHGYNKSPDCTDNSLPEGDDMASGNVQIASTLVVDISQTDETDERVEEIESMDETPPLHHTAATLLLVFGSSLSVARSYNFLWPLGLRRCLKDSTQRRSSSQTIPHRCQLVIVNLQPTCKDGLADVVIRAPCDEVLRLVFDEVLQTPVPEYDPVRDDPLLRLAVPLLQDEEWTRTRANIAFQSSPD